VQFIYLNDKVHRHLFTKSIKQECLLSQFIYLDDKVHRHLFTKFNTYKGLLTPSTGAVPYLEVVILQYWVAKYNKEAHAVVNIWFKFQQRLASILGGHN